ncbi:MAG: anthranilate synthase component I family protein [Chitinophagales bacterium]|nr:anthranilate synthase component I family protein [Chitinophagales bacterium]
MTKFPLSDPTLFKKQALIWANSFPTFCFLDNNSDRENKYHSFECLLGVDAQMSIIASENSFQQLQNFRINHDGLMMGYFSYDLKNQLEDLSSDNPDRCHFPEMYFFIPRYQIKIHKEHVIIDRPYLEAVQILERIQSKELPNSKLSEIRLNPRVSKESYIESVNKIKEHIVEGDVYELNFCQEFYAEETEIDPILTFIELNSRSKSPFSVCFKNNFHYALSMSPERFLKKEGKKIISQPIKGTIRKSKNNKENEILKKRLREDTKEQAENVMIVDLVRNDLTRSAVTGSIQVEELFGIYSFETVNHMISTVVAKMSDDHNLIDVIKNAFPMGSMTGAPKIKAMELIDKYESGSRGLYSGAIGYITEEDDFDFNVVIRTLLYNSKEKYLSYTVGGAITYLSDPEKEYEECFVKASALGDWIRRTD